MRLQVNPTKPKLLTRWNAIAEYGLTLHFALSQPNIVTLCAGAFVGFKAKVDCHD